MAEVGIVITAKDKASAVLSKIGSSGKKSLGDLGVSGKKFGDSFKALPDQLGKSSTALLLFQNSMSQVGGKAADAANKLTAVGGLVATGGPIGIGLAALTLGLGAATTAWEVFTMETKNAEAAQRSIDVALATTGQRILDTKNRIMDLSDQLRFFGDDATAVAIKKQQELVEANRNGVASIEAERDALIFNGRAFNELNAEQEQHLANLNRIIADSKGLLVEREKELGKMQELQLAQFDADQEREQAAQRAEARANKQRVREKARRDALLEERRLEREKEQMRKEEHGRELARLAERGQLLDAFVAKRAAMQQEQMSLDEEINKQKEADEDEAQARAIALTSTVGAATGQMVAELARGQQTSASMVFRSALSVARGFVVQAATKAGAAAGGFGPAAAAGAAAATFAALEVFLAKAGKFQFGGVVRGGQPNRDSVPAMLTPGERVLTQQQNKDFERSAAGSVGSALSLNFSPQINQLAAPESRLDRRKMLVDLAADLEEMVHDGMLFNDLVRGS